MLSRVFRRKVAVEKETSNFPGKKFLGCYTSFFQYCKVLLNEASFIGHLTKTFRQIVQLFLVSGEHNNGNLNA